MACEARASTSSARSGADAHDASDRTATTGSMNRSRCMAFSDAVESLSFVEHTHETRRSIPAACDHRTPMTRQPLPTAAAPRRPGIHDTRPLWRTYLAFLGPMIVG